VSASRNSNCEAPVAATTRARPRAEPAARVTPAAARLGEHPEFAVGSTGGARRLFRCQVFAPDGPMLPAYSKNILAGDGRASFTLPSALNDAPGEYTLRVTDAVTGASATAKITLR
jgi:hypothetical protein